MGVWGFGAPRDTRGERKKKKRKYFFLSLRLPLRAKCHARPACLIKRLLKQANFKTPGSAGCPNILIKTPAGGPESAFFHLYVTRVQINAGPPVNAGNSNKCISNSILSSGVSSNPAYGRRNTVNNSHFQFK